MGQGLRLTLAGVAIGLLGALGTAQLFGSLLIGVSTTDGISFGGMVALLITVALIAAYIPARRAAGIDPIQALRRD